MKLSYKKEYLINYIENDLMIRLFAEFREAQAAYRRSIYEYEHSGFFYRLFFTHPLKEPFGNAASWLISNESYKIQAVKDFLRSIKNADLLNPIVLDDAEINLLRL